MEETRSTPIEQSNVVAAFSNEGDHHGSNGSWIETSQCHLEESVDCASLSQAEKDWTSNELKQHQEDAIRKWIVKKPKSLKQKLPHRDKDGNLVLKKVLQCLEEVSLSGRGEIDTQWCWATRCTNKRVPFS